MDVVVNIPVNTPVGEYEVIAEAVDQRNGKQEDFGADKKIVILFNPFDKDDDVFIADEKEREEFVFNSSGQMWVGSHDNNSPIPWEYDQFASYSLNASLMLLERFGLDTESRRSPVHVSRTCAAMVNANDNDGGILYGRWSEPYAPHPRPTSWSGSGAILKQYWATKKAVKWAQCWVFGGVLASVLRSLGIPARPVTNFESAHDTDASRSIDFYLDENHDVIPHLSSDSIWNFHVWVEAWMERPDLKGHYGGWQAVDATPQEPSGMPPLKNSFTLGPAPLSAVKEGKDKRFDCEFVISEVNANIHYYVKTDSGFKLAGSNNDKVGKNMSTKAVGSDSRLIVTSNYKFPEGSTEEAAALERDDENPTPPVGDVDITIVPERGVPYGEELKAKLVFTSKAASTRNVDYVIRLSPVTYVGALGRAMARTSDTKILRAGATAEVPITLPPSRYIGRVNDQLLVNISAFVIVKETDFHYVGKETFRFQSTGLQIVVGDGSGTPVKVGTVETVKVTYTNPLQVPLTDAEFTAEGTALMEPLNIPVYPVPPGRDTSVTFEISPRNAEMRSRNISVTFLCRELKAEGQAQVHISPA